MFLYQDELEEKLPREDLDELLLLLLLDLPHPLCLNALCGFMIFLTVFNGFDAAVKTAAPAASPVLVK